MGEVKKFDEQKPKPFQTLGGSEMKKAGEGVRVLTQHDHGQEPTGEPKVLDKNSPVEPTRIDLHIHADKGSFKKATEKDQ